MTEPNLKTAKILTQGRLPDRFLETKIYEPTAPEESFLGNTYLLVEVTTPWFPTAKITKLIRNTFLEEYYHLSPNRQEVKRFEDGLKAINKKLSDLAGAGQTEWIGNLNAVIATISNKRLYLSHAGTAEAYLFRKNKISHITSGEDLPKNPAPIQTFSALISGELELEDKLVFSNSEMYNFVSIDTLRNALSQISPEGAVDEVSHILFKEKANKINAIFIYLADNDIIDTKTKTAMPDTIFLDTLDTANSIFKFKTKNIIPSTKIKITSLGFITLRVGNFIKNIFRKKPKEELIKNKSAPDLSYMTSSIDLNLSHGKDRSRPREKINIISWLKGLNKKWLYGGLVLLIILLVTGGIYFRIKSQPKNSNDLSLVVAAAQEKIQTADTQAALHNDNEARKLLFEAQKMLEEIKDKPKSPVEVIIILEKIQEKLDKINKVAHLDSPKELASLSSLLTDIEARDLIYLDGALYAINLKGNEVLAVIADQGDKEIVAKLPSDAGETQAQAAFENERLITIESSKGKLFEFSLKTNKLEEKKNSQEIAFPDADLITTYLSNIYFLNKNEGRLIKYAPSGAGFDKGKDVYRSGTVNLKDVRSLAIDGNIYLLHENGTIEKTLSGKIDSGFVLKNIPEPNAKLEDPSQILTNADSTSIYVLENKNHRIVELNKNGDYLRQFVFKENLGEINNIAANQKAKKLYLLVSNKIFEIDL